MELLAIKLELELYVNGHHPFSDVIGSCLQTLPTPVMNVPLTRNAPGTAATPITGTTPISVMASVAATAPSISSTQPSKSEVKAVVFINLQL